MERIEIITARDTSYDLAAKKLNKDTNDYLAAMESKGERYLINMSIVHNPVVHTPHRVEHFFTANIITAPIGSNTQFRF